MKQTIVYKLLSFLSFATGKFFLYITPSKNNALGKTAVQDKLGVWYVGNVYDKSDFTYGIAQNGDVESEETNLVKDIIKEMKQTSDNFSFYDIGANIGYYGLLVAKIYGAKVELFEPLIEYSNCIKKSSEINNVSQNIRIHSLALSDKKGMVEFTKSGSGSSIEGGFINNKDLEKINIPTETLDNIYEEKNFIKPDFIKIDVEGHELSVLKGGEKTIVESKPVILIELCTTLKDSGQSYVNPYYKETIAFLNKNNYEIYYIKHDNTLEKWSAKKLIDKAGMFLCLNRVNHSSLQKMIASNYKLID